MKQVLAAIIGMLAVAVLGAALWLYTPDKRRAVLEAQYGASAASYVEAAGMRLHVRDSGPRDAPAVVLLHGFGASLLTWDDWTALLASRFRVVSLDLPGFGLTGPDPTGLYTEARGVAVLLALMDRLGIVRASIVGNSMGGKLAWTFAALHPERVDKLVLISPDGFASPGFEYGQRPRLPFVVRLLPYTLPTAMVRATLAPAYGDPAALTDDRVARYRDMMLAPGTRGAMIARMEQVMPEDPEPLLARIRALTLLLWGERDHMIPFSNAQDYLRAIAGSRLVSFPDLGHVPQEEAPARSLAPVLSFLSGAEG